MGKTIVCIDCGQPFQQTNDTCLTCGWDICPNCGGCVCTVTPTAKVAAIAMWLTEVDDVPEDVRLGWLKFLKILAGRRGFIGIQPTIE